MIEKIGEKGYETLSTPSAEVISYLEKFKSDRKKVSVAEIGVGIGATSIEIVKRIDSGDDFYIFSFDNDVEELKGDLIAQDYCKTNIYAMGNTNKTYDSYSWTLAKMYQELEIKEVFDIVYLDGAHTFFHDGLACCLLKKMVKKGGIIIFDDMYWSFNNSLTVNPGKNPKVLQHYTKEQIEACQIALVVELFMEDDESWKCLSEAKVWRAIYERIK